MEAVRSRAVVQQEKDKQRTADRVRKTKQSGSGSSHAVAIGIAKGNAVSGSSSVRRQQSSQKSPAQRYQESVSPAAPETSRRYWISQIAKETERDEAKGQELYGLYEEAVADPSSPLYSVYDAPTSSNPKYNAQTEKAMTEWRNLQGELSYWAQNDRNYSDDEIIGRINWKNYPTLAKMNATKDGGQTVYLTQPIGYNEDAMYGVLWAARNPDIATDDMTINAGLSAGGYGKQYQRDSQKAARLDPSNPGYNPYLVGSTMDDEMRLYGVNGFDADWLENNLQYRGTDEYAKVYAAEQKTKKAESELESLKSTLESRLRSGLTYDEAMPADFDSSEDYSTLRAMQEGIAKGSPIALTRAVPYDPEGMRKAYDQAYTRLYGAESDSQYTGRVASATGAYTDYGEAQEMVDSAAAQQQRKYAAAVLESGTAEEQASVSATGKASYGTTTARLQQDIAQGTAGKEGAAASRQRTVSQQTATGYLNAVAARSAQPDYSEGLTRILDKAGVAPDSEDYTAKVAQSLAQQSAEGDPEAEQLLNEWNTSGIEEYWEKADIAETNQAAADEVTAIEAQWKEAYGDDTPEYRAHKNTMDYIAGFQAAPRVDGSAYGLIGQAQQEGADTSVYTSAALKNNQAQLATLDQAIADAQDWGAPDAYIENMQAAREQLLSQGRLIASYRLKDNEDYADGVAAFDQAEMNTDVARMNNADDEVIAAVKAPEAVNQYIHSPMQNPQALIRTNPDLFYAMEMTDDERSNFKYLYAAQGREEALAYYADLRGNLEERYAVAETEAANELGQKLPVTASLVSVATSPLQAEGVVYTLLQMLKGEEADPNAPAFSANRMISSSRQGVKDRFAEAVGDNELAKKVFAFFYDAMMSSGDSLVSAGIGGVTGFQNAGLALMSAEAASNAMQEARMKGADTKTAVWAGIASGAAEAMTEKIPFDRLTEMYEAGSAGGKVFKAIMDEIIGEGVGEGLSEYLGAAGDFMVMGDESEFAENVRQYRDEMGMTQEEAARAAFADLTQQALYAALAGTVSGGMSSAGAYLGGKIASRGKKADTQSQDTRQNTSPETQQATQQQEANQPVENNQPAAEPVQAESQRDTQSQNALNVLYTAQQNGVGTVQQTASVDAAMRSWGVEPATATATAKAVTESGNLGKVTQIMEAAQDKGKAAQALSMAMLSPDSESAAVLADMPAKVTSEDVVGLTQMYELDMKDAAAASAMDNAVERSQLADETVNALGQVDTGRVDAAQEAANKAAQQARAAQTDLADANARFTAADDALTQARTARQQNLSQETIAAESQALDQWAKARDARQKAARQYQTNMQALADATGKLRAAQQEGVNQARTMALEQQRERMEIKKIDYAVQQQNVDANIQQVAQMDSVVTLDGNEFEVGGTELRQQVSDYFESIGGVASNPILGDVALTKKGAKSSLAHGIGNGKAVAFAAVPSVIENGQIVDVQKNWKGRGYDTFVIAAPVTIEGGKSAGEYYCGVVVKRAAESQQYYVHEVVLANEEGANVAVQPTVRPNESSVALGGAKAPSVNSILQRVLDVKQGKMSANAVENANAAIPTQNGQNTAPAANTQENEQAGGNRAGTSQKGAQTANGTPRMGQSQFATKTGQNTDVLTDATKQKLRENPFYQKLNQKESVERAISKVEREGYTARMNRMLTGGTDILTPDGQTEAYVLSQIAKENGDTEGQAALAFKVKESGTFLAQSLAMRRLYTEMSPEAKVSYVQKLVDQINDQYESKGKDTRVTLPGWVEQAVMEAGDDQKRLSNVLDQAYREIAQQMPYTVGDTLRTWRFLSMLGNPMTHIKNMLANAAFMPYVAVKNRVAAGLEATVSAAQEAMGKETMERSKTFGPLKAEYKAYASDLCAQMKDVLSGNEKANATNGKSKVDEYRQKAPALIDWLSKKNADLLGGEDLMAKNHYFKYALASYLQANQVDLSNVSDTMLANATQYAVNEAYKNTFNNVNEFAKLLSAAERKLANSNIPFVRGGAILLEGTIPFKNTPANIVSRGVEYSPVGLFNAIFLNYAKLKKGVDYQGNAFTMQNYLDGIASGLTGTAAVALGGLLASAGVLDLGDDDDDEVRGKNKNSVNIPGTDINIGIDWSGVAAMPLLMGALLYNRWSEKNGEPLSLTDFWNGFKSIADPVMDLSMVQGLTALLDAAAYSDNAPGTMAAKMATSYLGQFVPTVFGAITRTFFDDTRRTTYTDKNKDLSSETQYLLQSMRNKIPGLSKEGMAYLDAWGNEQKTDSLLERFLTNFIIPGYAKRIRTDDEVTEALLEMYDEYGDTKYLPTKAKKYFTADGERYDLSQAEYTQYAKERGSMAHDLLGGLMEDETFRAAEPEFQLDAITDVWKYASQTAAYNVNDGFKRDSWVATTGSPKETILEKMQDRIMTADRNKFKESFFDAYEAGDVRSMRMCVAGLEQYGYKKSNLRKAVKERYQQQYRQMYEAGDLDGMRALRDAMLAADIGFKETDFDKWLEDGKK